MVGLDIEIPNKTGNFLADLFQNCDAAQYNWQIQYSDVVCCKNGKFDDNEIVVRKRLDKWY